MIATYAVDHVPWAWVEQTRPGGRIVAPWGRLGTSRSRSPTTAGRRADGCRAWPRSCSPGERTWTDPSSRYARPLLTRTSGRSRGT
ncbi:hypothetical protein [Streptomyces sp. Rer75]|uniref:hypothetical protein n=1 Tax=Streptomyces sp. Rer75 TaxID=2750011 RepID=UPI00211E0D6C|nr:hypothetical protein [Streptomyces sp. Rer75]